MAELLQDELGANETESQEGWAGEGDQESCSGQEPKAYWCAPGGKSEQEG